MKNTPFWINPKSKAQNFLNNQQIHTISPLFPLLSEHLFWLLPFSPAQEYSSSLSLSLSLSLSAGTECKIVIFFEWGVHTEGSERVSEGEKRDKLPERCWPLPERSQNAFALYRGKWRDPTEGKGQNSVLLVKMRVSLVGPTFPGVPGQILSNI